MEQVLTIDEARARLEQARARGLELGLVPTMGFLHDGHLSLMTAARRECGYVMATIFVNPLQFAPAEDLDAYPRDPERDAEQCADAGVDLLFVPSLEEMYPAPVLTEVSVAELAAPLEGRTRPTHFAGVATVVAKLFNIAGPCRAYFGEKDWQQLQVVRRMAADLSFPVAVVGCPIVRAEDGLALSSRNAYLDAEHRRAATALSRSLAAGIAAVAGGADDPGTVARIVASVIEAEPLAELDYAEVVDGPTLGPVTRIGDGARILVAARVGPARLIDNASVRGDPGLPA